MFWLVLILLGFVASVFILLPLARVNKRGVEAGRDQINLSLYREHLSELSQDALRRDEPGLDEPGHAEPGHAEPGHAEPGLAESGQESQGDLEELELEAKRDLLSDTTGQDIVQSSVGTRTTSMVAALLVPVFAFLVYTDFGLGRGAISDVSIADTFARIEPNEAGYKAFISQVEARSAQKPDDTDLLFLLARSYSNLGDFDKAAQVYADLLTEFPNDPTLASHYAEVLFVADGRKLSIRATEAIERALRLNPDDLTMLEIRAIAAIGEGDTTAALTWFHRGLQTGVTGRRAELIRLAMSQLNARPGRRASDPVLPEKTEQVSGRIIEVTVTASDAVLLPAESVVFVYARAAQGPPAPLAVKRLTLGQLPAGVRLDESMAMIPGMGLANFDRIVIIARVSVTGQVVPSVGDYEARSSEIDLTDGVLKINLEIVDKIDQ